MVSAGEGRVGEGPSVGPPQGFPTNLHVGDLKPGEAGLRDRAAARSCLSCTGMPTLHALNGISLTAWQC